MLQCRINWQCTCEYMILYVYLLVIVQMFLTTPAARLGTAFRIERVERTDTIFEVRHVLTMGNSY